MISLLVSFAVLILGFFTYGKLTEKLFAPDDRKTPATRVNDGVDCVPLPRWKAFLIQLLNIAGTGPIYGALMGAVFGPVVFLWIVFGSILGGAVHDYLCGMISSRHDGISIAELAGIYLGKPVKYIMRVFCVILLILCGAVFITTPASLLSDLTSGVISNQLWSILIVLYYILATMLPIDKLIGKLYPVFGVILIVMALAIVGGLTFNGNYTVPEIALASLHPDGLSPWPFMFVTVACGAISGFHATQSPVISKCIRSEKQGRSVFYGAMICEAAIALIWAAAGVAFYGTTNGLQAALQARGQSGVVYEISSSLLGNVGEKLAIIGVIICPISSGDTAFRSARLILAEWFGLKQDSLKNRFFITIPLLLIGFLLTRIDFDVLWRYFSWSNQLLATAALWVATSYLLRHGKCKSASLLTALPAAFMTAVTSTYILMSGEGLRLSAAISYPTGIAAAVALFVFYCIRAGRR